MKTIKYSFLIILSLGLINNIVAQQNENALINLLQSKNLITSVEADSLRKADSVKRNPLQSKHLMLHGFTQVRYQFFQQTGAIDGFDVRRARLDLSGNISGNWSYHVQADFAVTPKDLDAAIIYKLGDYLSFTAGQTKVPFSLESLIPSEQLELIDHSQVVTALAGWEKDVMGNQNGRDIGLQATGYLFKNNGNYLIEYGLGVFNGAGINTTDNNNAKDIAGRIVFHPIRGLGVGGSFYNGFDLYGTPAKNQVRNRYGAELSYQRLSYDFKGEYIEGYDGTIGRQGWYAQFGYFMLKQRVEALFKYDWYDPNINYAVINSSVTAYVFGVNYVIDKWSRIQVNYTHPQEEERQVENDLVSVQLQIGF